MLKKKKSKLSEKSSDYFFHKELREIYIWTSSNGRLSILKEMDLNHLKNIVKKIQRNEFPERESELSTIKNELTFREHYETE